MLQDAYALIYALKVWLTSLATTSILIMMWGLHIHLKDNPRLYIMLVGINIVQSIPTAVGLAISCAYLTRRIYNIRQLKVILSVLALILSYALFWLINGMKFDGRNVGFFMAYGSFTVMFIWVYKLKPYLSNDAAAIKDQQQDI